MQEKFALPSRLVIRIATMAIGIDVDVVNPHLSIVDTGKAVSQVDASFADRLDFGSDQLNAGFERLEDVIVVKRLAILGDAFLRLFAFGPHDSGLRA
jgi:hypothetical protein